MSIYDNAVELAKKLIQKFKNPKSQLDFQLQTQVPNGMGGFTVGGYVSQFIADGAVLPVSGAERYTSMQLRPETTHIAYIEHLGRAPSQDMRVVFNGRNFDIIYILNIAEADAAFEIQLREGVPT